eukprot:NODE_34_length_36538_cov_0.612854.p19 type:complete len:177 gc:universal NODE_34_length_36538_cov_0.612854:17671-18201(+)
MCQLIGLVRKYDVQKELAFPIRKKYSSEFKFRNLSKMLTDAGDSKLQTASSIHSKDFNALQKVALLHEKLRDISMRELLKDEEVELRSPPNQNPTSIAITGCSQVNSIVDDICLEEVDEILDTSLLFLDFIFIIFAFTLMIFFGVVGISIGFALMLPYCFLFGGLAIIGDVIKNIK